MDMELFYFLVCLEKLADVDQVPEYFHEMQSFVMKSFIPMHYINSLRFFCGLRELSLNVSGAVGEELKFLKLFHHCLYNPYYEYDRHYYF